MQNDDRTQLTIWLEGFEEPLNIHIAKEISQNEFEDLSRELLSNYIHHLRDKGQLASDNDNLIIINNVKCFLR